MSEAPRAVAFISHHSSQHDMARRLKAALGEAGIDGWMAPDDIDPGVTFDEAIIAQIRRSDLIVLLLSEAADRSRHVKRELMLAEDSGKPVYPVRLEAIAPEGLAYWLQDYQWIDWIGGTGAGLDRLIATIGREPTAGSVVPMDGPVSRRAPGRRLYAVPASLAVLVAATVAAAYVWWRPEPLAASVIEPGRWIARRDVTEIVYPEVPPATARQLEQMFENDPNPEECIRLDVARAPGVRLFDPGGEGGCTLTSFEMANGRLSGYLSCPLPGTSDGSVMQITFRGTYSRTTIETDNDITVTRPGTLMRIRSRDTSQWVARECAPEQGR
jgi:hypothetical protein